jgi:phage gp36-like protein
MISVQAPVERALLVAAPRKGSSDAEHLQEHLDELARLVDTYFTSRANKLSQ